MHVHLVSVWVPAARSCCIDAPHSRVCSSCRRRTRQSAGLTGARRASTAAFSRRGRPTACATACSRTSRPSLPRTPTRAGSRSSARATASAARSRRSRQPTSRGGSTSARQTSCATRSAAPASVRSACATRAAALGPMAGGRGDVCPPSASTGAAQVHSKPDSWRTPCVQASPRPWVNTVFQTRSCTCRQPRICGRVRGDGAGHVARDQRPGRRRARHEALWLVQAQRQPRHPQRPWRPHCAADAPRALTLPGAASAHCLPELFWSYCGVATCTRCACVTAEALLHCGGGKLAIFRTPGSALVSCPCTGAHNSVACRTRSQGRWRTTCSRATTARSSPSSRTSSAPSTGRRTASRACCTCSRRATDLHRYAPTLHLLKAVPWRRASDLPPSLCAAPAQGASPICLPCLVCTVADFGAARCVSCLSTCPPRKQAQRRTVFRGHLETCVALLQVLLCTARTSLVRP
jgi:hypothetical protein